MKSKGPRRSAHWCALIFWMMCLESVVVVAYLCDRAARDP